MIITTKKNDNHCAIGGKHAIGHALSMMASCGSIAGDGSRCDSNPHPVTTMHHCCGADWEKHW